MVGLYGGAPLEYAGIAAQGSDAVPSTSGEVLGASFGEGLAANLTPRMFRSSARFTAETGVTGVDDFGRPIMTEPEPTLDPAAANSEFGIKGHLSFDQSVPRSVAQDLFEHKRAQIDREDTIARGEGGLLSGGAARFIANLAAGVLDPVNLAVGFIPVIGEAREAALIAGAASAAGRAGIRAGLGGAQGAAGMAALQPLEFGLSRQEHEDYTAAMALRSIALGTVLGGGLHAGIGAAVDRSTGRYRNPLTQRIEDAGPQAREALLQGALADTIDGRPVNVAPALDAIEAARTEAERTPGAVASGVTISGENVPGELPIVRFRKDAETIEAALPPPEPDTTRLWRGNRPGEIGAGRQFTNDLPGIALPFREPYGGDISFVDVPTSELARYESTGGVAPGAEFLLPPELAAKAQAVGVVPERAAAPSVAEATVEAVSAARDKPEPRAPAAGEPSGPRSNDTLAEINAQVAELERMRQPTAPEPEAAARPGEPSPEAQAMADLTAEAEGRASAIERAALCITRG